MRKSDIAGDGAARYVRFTLTLGFPLPAKGEGNKEKAISWGSNDLFRGSLLVLI